MGAVATWTKTCGPIPRGLILTHTHFKPPNLNGLRLRLPAPRCTAPRCSAPQSSEVPVGFGSANWESAQLFTQILGILTSERVGYNVTIDSSAGGSLEAGAQEVSSFGWLSFGWLWTAWKWAERCPRSQGHRKMSGRPAMLEAPPFRRLFQPALCRPSSPCRLTYGFFLRREPSGIC